MDGKALSRKAEIEVAEEKERGILNILKELYREKEEAARRLDLVLDRIATIEGGDFTAALEQISNYNFQGGRRA